MPLMRPMLSHDFIGVFENFIQFKAVPIAYAFGISQDHVVERVEKRKYQCRNVEVISIEHRPLKTKPPGEIETWTRIGKSSNDR